MIEIVKAAGWPIWFLLITSVISVALIIERLYALQRKKVLPEGLLRRVFTDYKSDQKNNNELEEELEQHSPLGRVLAAGLRHTASSREIMKESIEESGRVVAHELEHYLTSIGTIATLSPLMGLFGTIVGMIEIFGSQTPGGGGSDPAMLAHGISIALYNTGFGLLIAMPSLIFWRHFRAKVDGYIIEMEQQATKLVEIVHGERSQ